MSPKGGGLGLRPLLFWNPEVVMAAESMWKLGGLTWKQLGSRLWSEIQKDEILDRAAGLAFYFLLALFPMALFMFSLLGIVASPELRNNMLIYVGRLLPGTASSLIQTTINEALNASGGGKLSFGLLLSLWSAAAGVVGMMSALNVVYDVKEERSFIKVRGIAIGLTVALGILVVGATTLVLYGGSIAGFLGAHLHLGSVFTTTWKVVQWPVALFALIVSYALIYYFAPNVEEQHWEWVTPGAVLGVTLWLLASFGFKAYLHYFNSYSLTYGALGTVIILMLWLYITGLAILIGGEINSEIEHAAAAHGDREAKGWGEKAPGEAAPRVPEKRPAA